MPRAPLPSCPHHPGDEGRPLQEEGSMKREMLKQKGGAVGRAFIVTGCIAMLLYSMGAAGSAHAADGARATSGRAATHSQVVYSTYLGGSDFDSFPFTALDRFGNLYLAGQTCSSDFPITVGAFQTRPGGGCDVYVAKL